MNEIICFYINYFMLCGSTISLVVLFIINLIDHKEIYNYFIIGLIIICIINGFIYKKCLRSLPY